MPNGSTIPSNWYINAFGELYPILYAHRDAASAQREAAFAVHEIGLSSTDRVLDLCCGNGRHLTHLLQNTPRAIGVDYSVPLLRCARQALGPFAPLLRADMRALPFKECFDAVFSFFTSFGYFLDESENHMAARAMAEALKPDGRFFLDYLNASCVETSLTPRSERLQDDWRIVEERWIDETQRRINKHTSIFRDNMRMGDTTESVRLYTFDELSALLTSVDLEINCVFGDYDGKPLDNNRPRMIILGQRKRGHAIAP